MMYSMSVLNMKKFSAVAISIRSGFGGIASGSKGKFYQEKFWSVIGDKGKDSPSVSFADKPKDKQDLIKELQVEVSVLDYVKNQLAVLKLDESIQPILDLDQSEGNKFNVLLSDRIYFDPGTVELSEDNIAVLNIIVSSVKNSPFKIGVEGYSSGLAEGSKYEDSWQLAAERARTVSKYMVSKGINPRRITITSYGEWKNSGKGRRLAMSSSGEWKPLSDDAVKADTKDRVVIFIVVKDSQ